MKINTVIQLDEQEINALKEAKDVINSIRGQVELLHGKELDVDVINDDEVIDLVAYLKLYYEEVGYAFFNGERE